MTQTERVVRFIRDNPGCSILDLTRGLDPFVANPRARISEARQSGIEIECKPRALDHRVGYWIVEPGQRTLGLDHVA